MSNGRRKTRCHGCGKVIDIPHYANVQYWNVECLDCTGTPIYEVIEYAQLTKARHSYEDEHG